ncbi:sensor histidine kinase [Aestuariimicrobium sp. T2.26MG-19.2B]|uniref:sensor histidine kinase n=1 Tax=Aestuariimicrobium sp. T2.26MG-19.2B TaxID=3040679 RepID=UPI002477C278|nr:ATP-binding protein [Aestuariimicrobium sp. T2.26MG-19.2B]CAI9411544.1 Adaptive-response sensory-kinase SasA [Aestuariimicrobium sp. T2.26MG-19.2B]
MRWSRETLAGRLMLGQTIVLLASILTAGLVASTVGPQIFHDHLVESGHAKNSAELVHVERAYREASALALGVALLISLACAILVSWLVSRRLRRALHDLTQAARQLSSGHYTRRVPTVGGGSELDTFAAAFNSMAGRLEDVEATRRRLLSDLAHELRTPIATLSAYHEGLVDGVIELDVDTRAVLTAQTDRLARLAEDIDDVSRAEEGRLRLELRPHRVADLVAMAADSARASYTDKGVSLVADLDLNAPTTVGVDADRVGQALGNLLTNALRHTPEGGQVSISARPERDEVVITITDTGEGISPAQLPHIFERFYRGDSARDRNRSGSGIGLTISKAIIEAHGGTITAHSSGHGHGATFAVLLPRRRL